MEMSVCPYLGFFGGDALFEFQLADHGVRQSPDLMFGVPDAAGCLDAAAQFGFAVGDPDSGAGWHRAFGDDQLDSGEAFAGFRFLAVAHAVQRIAKAFRQALGTGCGGREFLDDGTARRHAGAAVRCGATLRWCCDGHHPPRGRILRATGTTLKHTEGACEWQARWHGWGAVPPAPTFSG